MKKDIRDFVHFYFGGEGLWIKPVNREWKGTSVLIDENTIRFVRDGSIKLLLRNLSSMTEEEATELILILTNSNPELEEKIDADEIILELAPNDGGIFVDGDMAIVLDYSCRCFEGQLGIRECGSLILHDSDSGKQQILTYVPEGFRFLLRKGFDLFGLIESGLALDITKQPAQ